jgi:hypothetical protein
MQVWMVDTIADAIDVITSFRQLKPITPLYLPASKIL